MCPNSPEMPEDSPSLPKFPRLRPDREKFAIVPKPNRKVVHMKGASLQDCILAEGASLQVAIMHEEASLQDVILPEETSLQDAFPTEESSLQDAILTEEATLKDAILPEEAPLQDAILPEEAPLYGVIQPEEAALHDAVLPEEASLQDAILPEKASVQDAILPEEASLHDAILTVEAALHDVVLPEEAALHDAVLPEEGSLHDSILPEEASLHDAILPEEVSLHDAILPEEASLYGAILPKEASLYDAILPEEAVLHDAVLPEEAALHDAVLPEEASLHDAILPEEASLHDAILPEEASLHEAILPEEASLHDAILLLPKPPLPKELILNESNKSPIDKPLLKERPRNEANQDLPTSSPMTFLPTMEPRHLREKWLVSKCSKKRPLIAQSSLLQEPALHQLQHESSIPMTFYPSMEELASFDTYVAYMESQGAHKAGIARIVPPKDWTARKAGYEPSEVDIIIDNPVKQNIANTKVPGAFTTIGDRTIPSFTLPEYLRLATSPKYLTPSHSTYEELEELYWQQNQDPSIPSPIYGADIQTSLTDPDQTVFNLSNLPNILSGMAQEIPGINTPYCYVGMWRATFSWHVEDMDLYATNFLHYGASKTWYCVPPEYGYKLEQLAQKLFPEMTETCFNLLRHKAVMIGPKLLRANGIPVNKLVHEQGTIMVVFPHAYHSGFNHGFNMAETLNFALPRWVEYGKRFRGCLCGSKKMAVRVNMDMFVEKFQPEKLEEWRRGEDFALHPEDPEFVKKYFEDLKMRAKNKLIKKEMFETVKGDLMLKREIAPLFKEKFPLDYTDVLELVIEDNVSEETKVDENDNEIPRIPDVVKNLKKRPFAECCVKMKCLDEDVTTKHLDEMKAYEAILEEQRLEHEAKTAAVKVGQAGGGSGFKGVDKDDLKAKKSLVLCSANRKHKFKACSKCPGCLEPNCDICVHCVDSPRNGGRNVLRQKCVQRLCINPVMGTCGSCRWQI